MTTLSLLTLLGRVFDPLAALLDEAADTAKTREAAKVKLAALKAGLPRRHDLLLPRRAASHGCNATGAP
ncbi:hypothetical protein AB8879_02840 [Alphaproteobacteria bacterium LSUCC0744]